MILNNIYIHLLSFYLKILSFLYLKRRGEDGGERKFSIRYYTNEISFAKSVFEIFLGVKCIAKKLNLDEEYLLKISYFNILLPLLLYHFLHSKNYIYYEKNDIYIISNE